MRAAAKSRLGFLYIGSGRCAEAAALLTRGGRSVDDLNIMDAFNYGMALWGATGALSPEPFRRVVELARDPATEREGPNHLQCLTVANRAVGDLEAAGRNRRASREALLTAPASVTASCRRYEYVSRIGFIEDLDEIGAWIAGDDSRKPRFMKGAPEPDDGPTDTSARSS